MTELHTTNVPWTAVVPRKPKLVVLGMMTKMPVAGIIWLTVPYLVGLRRLGYDVYYVEAHARTPSMFMERPDDDGAAAAASFIHSIMRRFDFADRWAYHALHADGRVYGLGSRELDRVYRSAAVIINLHGGTEPRSEHTATGQLVYIETDPVELELELANGSTRAESFLSDHDAFFTWGLNYGNADCGVPLPAGKSIHITRPPVLLDEWRIPAFGRQTTMTTVGNWRQQWRDASLDGELYHWSKHLEFLKFIDLPQQCTGQSFELALSGCDVEDRTLLEKHGWYVRDALQFGTDLDSYRRYIVESRGEFTVAKDQNVRLRSGWFSDRSATYLAAGRPVVTQETGFSNSLPTGHGLFGFTTMDEILEGIALINGDYRSHVQGAAAIAREYFDAKVVLRQFLRDLDLSTQVLRQRDQLAPGRAEPALSPDLRLTPASRWPTVMPEDMTQAVLHAPVPLPRTRALADPPDVSVVVVTCKGLPFTRLCLESVLANTDKPPYELVVVDNASSDGTAEYLELLGELQPHVRVLLNGENRGFATAANQGLAAATAPMLVLLNNDTVVSRGWLDRLIRHLAKRKIGLIGAVSNRTGDEAEVEQEYETYAGFVEAAERRYNEHRGRHKQVEYLALCCAAMRREVQDLVGPLDERFEIAMFEDDDYAVRLRHAGYQLACAEDVLIHHFGQASVGQLAMTGDYGSRFATNRGLFERKWGVVWTPHPRRHTPEREQLAAQLAALLTEAAAGATVLVVDKGDADLVRSSLHHLISFPSDEDGVYAGFHPATSTDAIGELERMRASGADYLLIPKPQLWWLEHYEAFHHHLSRTYSRAAFDEEVGALYALHARRAGGATAPATEATADERSASSEETVG